MVSSFSFYFMWFLMGVFPPLVLWKRPPGRVRVLMILGGEMCLGGTVSLLIHLGVGPVPAHFLQYPYSLTKWILWIGGIISWFVAAILEAGGEDVSLREC